MNRKFGSIVGHAIAGFAIVAIPLFVTGAPAAWQEMTLGAVLAGLLKWAHLYLNDTLA